MSWTSIVLTRCFPDEEAQKADTISERVGVCDKPTVPAFWRHEVLNALDRLARTIQHCYLGGAPGVDWNPPNNFRPSGNVTVRALATLLPSFAA
jgi:hypothetical protein